MIKIKVKEEKGRVKEVLISGHALYDDYGKDIVCASVSSIVITSVNAILRFDKSSILYSESPFIIKINKYSKEVDILISNMIDLLKELERDYPKNVKFL